MAITVPPAGLILDGGMPLYGGMKTGNLILNGDFEANEFATPVWRPSLFTYGLETGTTGAWSRLTTLPHAGLASLQFIPISLTASKPAWAYQVVPLNPGAQFDQLQLWHRCRFTQKCDSGLESVATIRVSFDLVGSSGSLTNLLTWTSIPHVAGTWLECSREFRPSDLATRAVIDDAVELRVTLNVWPSNTGACTLVARFDDFTLEAECSFTRNFSVGGLFDHERDSVFERGTDVNRTMYQTASGRGAAKRVGSIPFRLITERQRDNLHGLWLYGARQYVTWYPVMVTYPESINIIFDRKWSFPAANANVDVGFNGTLGYMEH